MQKRKSVVLVMYDLPVQTRGERKAGEKFRKYLIRRGFVFIQKSVYVKLFKSRSAAENEINLMFRELPDDGTVNVPPLSLADFENMITILGNGFNMSVFADDLIIV